MTLNKEGGDSESVKYCVLVCLGITCILTFPSRKHDNHVSVLCCLCIAVTWLLSPFLDAKRWCWWGSSLPENWVLQALEEPTLILGSLLEQAFTSSHSSPVAKQLVFP